MDVVPTSSIKRRRRSFCKGEGENNFCEYSGNIVYSVETFGESRSHTVRSLVLMCSSKFHTRAKYYTTPFYVGSDKFKDRKLTLIFGTQ